MRLPVRAALALASALCVLAGQARASYVRDYPVSLEQPDGSRIKAYLSGDEYSNWAHDAAGYAIVRDPASGYVVYASKAAGTLHPTSLVVGKADPVKAGLVRGEKPALDADGLSRLKAREDALEPYRAKLSHNSGSFTNLVIFIRFSDEAATAFGHKFSEYDAMLNGLAGTNSMRNYYKEVSYGKLTINSAFYPVQSGVTVVSFQDTHPRAYYKPYDATTNPTGYISDGGSRENALLTAAVNAVRPAVEAAGLDPDADNDGIADNVVFIVSGDTTAWSTLLWPHMSWMGNVSIAGATVGTYNFQLENFLFGGRGVGVFCHEMFHSLGSPDLYHYTDNGIAPAGSWDIMEWDRNPPQHMLAHMKWKYGGWLPPLPEITAPGHYTLNPTTLPNGSAFRIRSTNSLTEYFVVEYRRKTGIFESSLPNTGLIVYRIDPTVGGNASGPPDEVYVYRLNGTRTSNGDPNTAAYSSNLGRTSISASTNPKAFLQDGAVGYLDLRNVGSAGTTISFDLYAAFPPATRLGFVTQPGPAVPGGEIPGPPQVAALTVLGLVNTNYTGLATVGLKAGTGTPGAAISGSTQLTIVNGVASFPGLSVDVPGSGYVLTASSATLAAGDSAPFSVTPSGVATQRLSVSSTQAEAARPPAVQTCVSSDGLFAAFVSSACNLAAGDTNNADDVFVRDLTTGAVVRASVSSSGAQANGYSAAPALSATGRFVVFDSTASNLVAGDTNNLRDVFLRDLQTGVTERVSVTSAGGQAYGNSYSGGCSADGRYVAFASSASGLVVSDTNSRDDIFVRDRTLGTTTRVSVGPGNIQANGGSYRRLCISDDGGTVAFQSDATNLVSGDSNGRTDIFVWSRSTGAVERASISTSGTQGSDSSVDAGMSPDGRYVVFTSAAANLVTGDTNGCWDIFLRDRQTGATERVSLGVGGAQANNYCWFPDVSADGRYVCFDSWAGNLAPSDTNGTKDVFIRDRATATTRRMSIGDNGAQAAGYSESWTAGHTIGAGPVIAFRSDAEGLTTDDVNAASDAFVRNVATGHTVRVSAGPDGTETGGAASTNVSLSGDGRYAAFQSPATNLSRGDTNDRQDIFVRDTRSGATESVSVSDGGAPGNGDSADATITPDGRYVSFTSWSGNLVPDGDGSHQNIYVRDRSAGTTIWASQALSGDPNGDSVRPSISADGSCVAFISHATNLVAGDTNGQPDCFWRNLATGVTKRLSVSDAGAQGNGSSYAWFLPSLSADGRYVCFSSYASNLVANDTNGACDVFVYDTATNHIECVSVSPAGAPGAATSWWGSMTPDGRYVAFMSDAANLVAGDTNSQADVFVRDRQTGTTVRVSVGAGGMQSTGNSRDPSISANGRYVAFKSSDGNLVPGDTNGQTDVFVVDTTTVAATRVSVDDAGTQGDGESSGPASLSADGRYVAFHSAAANLVPGDRNANWDVFLRGPLWRPFTAGDALDALRAASGLAALPAAARTRLDVVSAGASAGRVDMADAAAIARKAAGLDANP